MWTECLACARRTRRVSPGTLRPIYASGLLISGAALLLGAELLFATAAVAEIEPEEIGTVTMPPPQPHWLVTFADGAYIWDGDTGEMQGKFNISDYTSGVVIDHKREMIYVPGSYYARNTYGERTDVVTFTDFATLSPVAEVVVPTKLAAVFHRATINPVGEDFIGLYNMTPAMSVSIVDVEKQVFVAEISTPGCALVYPVTGRRFMQICGDGTLQVITLDRNGRESQRIRSEVFFDPEADPIFDYAVPMQAGWIFVSFDALVYEVTIADEISVAEPWSLLTEEDREENWHIGGHESVAYNAEKNLLLTLMHQGGEYGHEDPGTAIWGYDFANQRRGYQFDLEEPTVSIAVTADEEPLLFVVAPESRALQVRNAVTGRLLRTIKETGAPNLLQRF